MADMTPLKDTDPYLNNILSRGWDNFYEIPKNVCKFIKKTKLREGYYMKVQSIAHLITVFDGDDRIVRRIPYEAIQDRPMLSGIIGDLNG